MQTPRGFVEFPGTFALDRELIVITVPWSSIGNIERGEASVFVDRSDASTEPVRYSEDFLPESDRIAFTR